MQKRIHRFLRRVAEWVLRTQHYRHLRAHLWEDAVSEMDCRKCS